MRGIFSAASGIIAAMPEASCHCGAVRIVVPTAPEFLVDCNCSICRRNGALWAFYAPAVVELNAAEEQLTAYVWGARTIRTMHCRTCGCATHWEPLLVSGDASGDASGGDKLGVNARMFDPAVIAGVRVRRFDGAHSWTYFD